MFFLNRALIMDEVGMCLPYFWHLPRVPTMLRIRDIEWMRGLCNSKLLVSQWKREI